MEEKIFKYDLGQMVFFIKKGKIQGGRICKREYSDQGFGKIEPRLITKQFYWLRKPNDLSFWKRKFSEEDLFPTLKEIKKNIIGEQK